MPASRFVIPEILRGHVAGKFLRQQCQKRHDIGLFDDLRILRPLPAEYDVHGHGPARIVVEVDIFQPEEPGELLEQSCLGGEAVHDAVSDLPPLVQLQLPEVELG